MALGGGRVTRVTTKKQLEVALDSSADKVIVEGDDELLSYAVSRAGSDPENEIEIQIDDSDGEIHKTGNDPPERSAPKIDLCLAEPVIVRYPEPPRPGASAREGTSPAAARWWTVAAVG